VRRSFPAFWGHFAFTFGRALRQLLFSGGFLRPVALLTLA